MGQYTFVAQSYRKVMAEKQFHTKKVPKNRGYDHNFSFEGKLPHFEISLKLWIFWYPYQQIRRNKFLTLFCDFFLGP
jgi:hypothetical protein